jgi:16S rRNA pseudouridine516 synthase
LVLLHKPVGYTCTHSGDEGPTIYELLPPRWLARNPAITSVGRLDKETSGLLLLTDVGKLVQRWTSPKSEVDKVYELTVDGPLSDSMRDVFASGTLLLRGEEKPCLPAQLMLTGQCTARITIQEGRYHQVRRMLASQGVTVTRLHRVQFGPYALSDLAEGTYQMLNLPDS